MGTTLNPKTLLRDAALEAVSLIRTDRARVSARLRPLLRYLEDHLFDRSLAAGSWLRAFSLDTSAGRALFKKELNTTPHAYYDHLRAMTAKSLLRAPRPRVKAGATLRSA